MLCQCSIKILSIFTYALNILLTLGQPNYTQLNYNDSFKQQKLIHQQQLFQGSNLFQNSDPSTSTVNQIALSGWYFTRCSGNVNQEYFSFLQNGVELFSVLQNISTAQIIQKVLSVSSPQSMPSLAFNLWVLVKVTATITSNQLTVQTSIHTSGNSNLILFPPSTQAYMSSFSKSNLILRIGCSTTIPGINESCAYTNNLYFYWDSNVFESNNNKYADDYTAISTKLIWNFDTFYTRANPNVIFNVAWPMKMFLNSQIINQQITLNLMASQYVQSDFVNALDFGGFAISFHFKLNTSATILLMNLLIPSSPLQIILTNSGQMKFQSGGSSQITGINLNQWNQVTLIVKTITSNIAYLVVSGFESQVISKAFTTFMVSQVQFGDTSNTVGLQIAHIRYYKGTFFTSNQGDCLLQDSRYVQSCIICKSSFYLNYQGSLDCVTQSLPSKNTDKDNIVDWNFNFNDCPQNMVYNSAGSCQCLYQFYLNSSNICTPCPNYCKGCTDSVTCIKQDPNRLSNGSCPSDYFDDGYTCINNMLIVYSRNNIEYTFPTPDLSSTCATANPTQYTFTSSSLNIGSQYSFFFSFSYSFIGTLTNKYSFAFLSDGAAEIFTFSYDTISGNQSLVFEVFGVAQYSPTILTSQVVWVALWTDLKSVVLLVQSYSEYFSKTININLNFQLVNPQICVGPCKSKYHPNYLCGNVANRPFLFIRNMTNPTNDLTTMQMYLSNPVINIANFKVIFFSNLQLIYQNQLSVQTALTLDFQSTPVLIDRLKGFGFNQNNKAYISNINNQGFYWITIYCSIFPQIIDSQVSLLSYPLNGKTVEYLLVPYGQKVQIRICYLTACKDTQYAMLNINDYNTLFIIMRFQSPFSGGIHFIEFDIICNYLREQIQFLSVSFTVSTPTLTLGIGVQTHNTQNYLFYLNNLSIDKGDGLYYFDYTSGENCFIFSDFNSMNCLLNKDNLISYKGSLITVSQCLSYNNLNQPYFIVDYSTRECIDTQQIFQYCKTVELINNILQCTACYYPNMDPSNNCNCIAGYYQDNTSKQCFSCNPPCLTCAGSANNCLSCIDSNSAPPTCNCVFPNYFLNQQYKCQLCSNNCSTCSQDVNTCLTCSQNRVFPPDCNCDKTQFVEVNGVCQNITCQNICKTCQFDISSNKVICLTCNTGRQNAPSCQCFENYKPNLDGTCSPCPQSTYYDSLSSNCLPCQFPCLECSGTKDYCTFCYDGLELSSTTCKCTNGLELALLSQTPLNYSCNNSMNVSLQVSLQGDYYVLQFIFPYDLNPIDFTSNSIQTLVNINLSNIPTTKYSISNPSINGNIFQLQLNVYQSFHTNVGMATFLQTNKFMSSDKSYVLSSQYQTKSLNFDIGPFLLTSNTISNNIQSVLDIMKNEKYQSTLKAAQQTQMLFYFLNTAQPTMLFLLVKAVFPPNLYMFYQVFGMMVYPNIVDYQSTNYQQQFSYFGYDFNQTEVFLSPQPIFKRIGFSNSFLINTLSCMIKYLGVIVIVWLLKIILLYSNKFSNKVLKTVYKIKQILLQRLNSENETNLLLITISILHQYTILDSEVWSERYGYYCATIFLLLFSLSFYLNFMGINYSSSKNSFLYSFQFIERLPQNNQSKTLLGRNYFLIQLFKKYLVIIVLFSLTNSPYIACTINGLIFLISSLLTMYHRPYKNTANRLIKISGEILFSIAWFLHIGILVIEDQPYKQQIFDDHTISMYLNIGNAIIIILLTFNLIFFSEYFIIIYSLFKKILQKRRKRVSDISHKTAAYNSQIYQIKEKIFQSQSSIGKSSTSRIVKTIY